MVARPPVNVIIDTDICLDLDDAMAVAIAHAVHGRGEANLVAVTTCIDEEWVPPYLDALQRAFGHPDIPIGAIENGLTLLEAARRIHRGMGGGADEPVQGAGFAQVTLDRRHPDGSALYPRSVTSAADVPEAVGLLRRTLAEQPDGSVIMIQIGNSTNFARLLDSRPDEASELGGRDLIRQKVRSLSVMAGTFDDVSFPGGLSLPIGSGINVFEDVEGARRIFDDWPTPIIVNGTETGEVVRLPLSRIRMDLAYTPSHPIVEGLKLIEETWGITDHHTCDLVTVLHALRPDGDYFSLSEPGRIHVHSNGSVEFEASDSGTHRYLTVSDEQRVRSREAMLLLMSQPTTIRG
jgi:inosine-uridine nucleoside N-ribohydrolase